MPNVLFRRFPEKQMFKLYRREAASRVIFLSFEIVVGVAFVVIQVKWCFCYYSNSTRWIHRDIFLPPPTTTLHTLPTVHPLYFWTLDWHRSIIILFYIIGCDGRLCLRWWFVWPPALCEGWVNQLDAVFLVHVENHLKEHLLCDSYRGVGIGTKKPIEVERYVRKLLFATTYFLTNFLTKGLVK